MKRFQIIIKDLEEGNTIKDIKTNCIIGAIDEGDGVAGVALTNCNGLTIKMGISAIEKTVADLKKSMADQVLGDALPEGLKELLDRLTKGE